MTRTIKEFLQTNGVLVTLKDDKRITRSSLDIVMGALSIPKSGRAWDKSKNMWFRLETFNLLHKMVNDEQAIDVGTAYQMVLAIRAAFTNAGFKN